MVSFEYAVHERDLKIDICKQERTPEGRILTCYIALMLPRLWVHDVANNCRRRIPNRLFDNNGHISLHYKWRATYPQKWSFAIQATALLRSLRNTRVQGQADFRGGVLKILTGSELYALGAVLQQLLGEHNRYTRLHISCGTAVYNYWEANTQRRRQNQHRNEDGETNKIQAFLIAFGNTVYCNWFNFC